MNTNMRLLALILFLMAPTWAAAQKYDENVKLSDIGPFYIEVIDTAQNGCWTNIAEAKSYAAGQITLAGGNTVDTRQEANGMFLIAVTAKRMENGMCYGHLKANFGRYENIQGFWAIAYFSELGTAGVVTTNFNNDLLDWIKRAIAEWR